jgi:Protein of unknown function (DUF3551)
MPRAVQAGRASYDGHFFKLHDDHTSISSRGDAFCSLAGTRREILCFLLASVALTLPASHLGLLDLNQNRKNKMKPFLKMAAAPASAMLALAFVAITTPASAGEYCRTDVTSHMQSCSFDTLEQCQMMSAGRGGSCDRDPFLATTSNAYAYQAKPSHSKRPVQAAKRPVEGR